MHLKQGLLRDALVIYRQLLAAASDEGTRARRAQRIAELELRDSGPHAVATEPPATDIRALLDYRQVTFDWRLPAERSRRRCRSWCCAAKRPESPRSAAPSACPTPRERCRCRSRASIHYEPPPAVSRVTASSPSYGLMTRLDDTAR